MAISEDPAIHQPYEQVAPGEYVIHIFPRSGDVCFFCGDSVSHPALYWFGFQREDGVDDPKVWLHQRCARMLARRLLDDAERLEP